MVNPILTLYSLHTTGQLTQAASGALRKGRKMRVVGPEPGQVRPRDARKGFVAKVIEKEMRKMAYSVKELEAGLSESRWMAGDQSTLGDICKFAIANGMQGGFPELVNDKDAPRLIEWINRINERPA